MAAFRHRDAPTVVDNRATQAATSLCVTAANGTRSQVGKMHVITNDR